MIPILQHKLFRSCAKLAYEHAQAVIEGGHIPDTTEIIGHAREKVEQDILKLEALAKKLRNKRFKDGALSINSVKLSFSLDNDGRPKSCWVYQQKDSNRLIEEVTCSIISSSDVNSLCC